MMTKRSGLLLIIGLLVVLFHQLFYAQFAYSDSYDFLVNANHPYFFNRWVQSGRILFGVLAEYFFTSLDIESLMWVRAFALTGTVLFIGRLYYHLCRFFAINTALFIALIVVLSPSVTVITFWTCTFQVSWALFLGLEAGIQTLKSIQNRFNIVRSSIILIVSLVSLHLYQPGFTAFILPLFLSFIFGHVDRKKMAMFVAIQGSIYLLYFVSFKTILYVYDIAPESRSGISLNILKSIKWLAKPFAVSTWFNYIFAPRWLQTLLTCLSLFALLFITRLKMKGSWLSSLEFLIWMGGFYCLSILPNFLAVDNFISYRMLTVMFVVTTIIFGYAVDKLIVKTKIKDALMSTFLVVLFASGYYNTNFVFIDIQEVELEMADTFVKNLDRRTQTLVVVPPDPDFLVEAEQVSRIVTDEFGKLSNGIPWVPKPFFERLMEKHNLSANLKILPIGEIYQPSAGEVLFDWEEQWNINK